MFLKMMSSPLIKVTYRFPQVDAQWEITYKVFANGIIKVDNRFVAEGTETPMIPRVGLRMQFIGNIKRPYLLRPWSGRELS